MQKQSIFSGGFWFLGFLQAKNVVRTRVLVPIGWSRFSRHPYLETPLNRCFMTPTWWKPEAVTQDSQRLRGRGRRRLNGLSLLFQTTPDSSKLASTTLRYGLFLPGHLSHVIVFENENLEIEFAPQAGQAVRISTFGFLRCKWFFGLLFFWFFEMQLRFM